MPAPVPVPVPAPAPGLAQPCPAAGEEPEAGTTFCMLLPRMPQWKFPGPGGFLSRSPSGSSKELSSPARPGGAAEPGGAPSSLAAVLGACEPGCSAPCSLPGLSRLRAGAGAARKAARAEGARPGGEDWNRKGSFISKPAQGWLHPDERVLGPGVSYIVRVSAAGPAAPRGLPGAPPSPPGTQGTRPAMPVPGDPLEPRGAAPPRLAS